MDANVRRLNAEVPSFVQWDDHETLNNWYPGEQLEDDRYQVKSVSLLSARARQAFLDYLPILTSADGLNRIYRTIPYGPLLEVFFIDLRTYRGPNSTNRQTELNEASAFMGKARMEGFVFNVDFRGPMRKIEMSILIGHDQLSDRIDFTNC